jgi:hypothetical protein
VLALQRLVPLAGLLWRTTRLTIINGSLLFSL